MYIFGIVVRPKKCHKATVEYISTTIEYIFHVMKNFVNFRSGFVLLSWRLQMFSATFFGGKSPRVSGTQNGGTGPYKAILGVGFPLHKPYIQLV